MNRSIINLIHLLFVAPMLIYLGLMKERTDKMIFNFVLIVGIIVLLYHGYLIVDKNFIKQKNNSNYNLEAEEAEESETKINPNTKSN